MNDAPKRRSRVQQEQPAERTGSRHRSRRSRGGRKNGKALYYAVLVILVGVLVFSSVKIISYLKEQKDTERINDNINQDFISPDDTAGDTDTDGDGTDGDSQETQKPVKKDEESIKVDFTAMQAKYPDVVGYVYSANTTLQLPIVQSADEGGEYYLYRDIDGKDNKNGTVFLDIRCNSDFTSQNNLIYGHNMKTGMMFASLMNYKSQSYYEAHPYFYLYTPNQTYKVNLFAGCIVDHDADVYATSLSDSYLQQCINESTFKSGSGVPNKTKVATISKASIQKIAEIKMKDLNAASLESAMSMIAGTCRSMGVVVGD